MKKNITLSLVMLVFVFALWKCVTPHHSQGPQPTLPGDVCKSCVVTQDTFKSWFVGNQITANGVVTPANSVKFVHNINCDFYKWSERMFLWITSPTKTGSVLSSTEFYNVSSPLDTAGDRELIPHTPGTPLSMTAHIAKFGPDRLPMIRDVNGKFFEVERAGPKTKDVVKDATGKTVEVDHVKAEANNTYSFIDKAGKTITHPTALLKHTVGNVPIAHLFMVGKKAVLLDADGNVVESEEGQATGDGLMAQNGSLVYYMTLVNDVYAEYLNLAKSLPAGSGFAQKFPTTAADRDVIYAYALLHKVVLPDPNALAMEVKSSWVEAASLGADSANYFKITAVIPVYNKAATIWLPTDSTKTTRMALVGMHVVGSVAGHPEMIWSTFEHKNNTPNAVYTYLDSAKTVKSVAQDAGTNWLFSNNAADSIYNPKHKKDTAGKANLSHITTVNPATHGNGNSSDTVFANNNFSISASNTQRIYPWGGAPGSFVNPQDSSVAASNSEIISINNAIQSLLPAGDVRANYLFIGSTWTPNGTAPTGLNYQGGTVKNGDAIGTSVVANSTMETYFQAPTQTCLFCHSNTKTHPLLTPEILSHVYANILTFKADSIRNAQKPPKKK